jgi:2-polyprenyl-6-hydroxyphenyl methylase/3-demethylubiquinone-9 3-methyltransferase
MTVEHAEVEKFGRSAEEWWDPSGVFRPLHGLNPTRIAIIRDALIRHFGRDARAARPLDGLRLLDLGCGGGLVAEPMARLGANVTGADPSEASITVAASHASRLGLKIDYRQAAPEDLEGEAFDAVLALEIIEHAADPFAFVATAASLVAPGGLVILSTINRTLHALALAKISAEYLFNWVPRGTHEFRRFVTPRELRHAFESAGLAPSAPVGMTYHPFKDEWKRSFDVRVNYIMWATRP